MRRVVRSSAEWRASWPADPFILVQRVEDGGEALLLPTNGVGRAFIGDIEDWLYGQGFMPGVTLDVRGEGRVLFHWLTAPDEQRALLAVLRWSGVNELPGPWP